MRLNVSIRLLTPLLAAACISACTSAPHADTHNPDKRAAVKTYIAASWDALTRTIGGNVNSNALADSKLPQGQTILYVPADEPITDTLKATALAKHLEVRTLPAWAKVGNAEIKGLTQQGLLYLPNPYVVPGGRFNEMYGWDSYFILEGLLADGRLDLAKGMTENFFYELDHYGAVLNANRTYYLTRSQPPFLTSMILEVDEAMASAADTGVADSHFLEEGYAAAQKDWAYWNRPELHAGDTGLTRYFDYGTGPVPEMQDDASYYVNVVNKLTTMGDQGLLYLTTTSPRVLTNDFYLGDRALRSSGFDITFRFGPYGGATHHFAPVCLNSLLYKEETDLAGMAKRLGKTDEAATWESRAAARKAAIFKYLYDENTGLFFDYDFLQKKQSTYKYATTFYPLWANLVTKEQASLIADHVPEFLHPGGLATSTTTTGVQWDAPFGWAPLQFLAVTGLDHYGLKNPADAIANNWTSMIEDSFAKEKTIHEKYNVLTRSADVNVAVGYSSNVIGFGWTNGVYLKLISR